MNNSKILEEYYSRVCAPLIFINETKINDDINAKIYLIALIITFALTVIITKKIIPILTSKRIGQKILDIGTGTGILPLNMIKFGGEYTGVDLSYEMIKQAKSLNSNITYLCSDAHQLPFENNSFDVVTALQCWVYFDKELLLPELKRVLKRDGNLYVMFLTWLPDEDKIIKKSLDLVKKYNHKWSGFMKRADCLDLHWLNKDFSVQNIIKKDYQIPFSRNEWCNRMIASRGIGATLSDDKILEFKKDLIKMLNMGTDEYFTTLHEAVILKLKRED